jgi:heme-degrading monooxygenase HmoA
MTIARSVRFPIQPGKKAEFTKTFAADVLPVLQRQEGFKDEILLVNDDHVLGISVWSGADEMKKYASATYPKIEARLSGLMSGKVQIETFEVTSLASVPA